MSGPDLNASGAVPGPVKQVIALDVGGASIRSAVVALGRNVLVEPARTPIDSSRDAEHMLDSFTQVVRRHFNKVKKIHLLGVAIGFPGPFDYACGICRIKDLDKYGSLYGVNVKEELRARSGLGGLPIAFRNDAEAAIVGEALYGAGRPYRRLIGVTLGTGCGSAFLAGGRPVTSGDGVPPNGWLYPMPVHGMRADDVFSRRGLEMRLQHAGSSSVEIPDAANTARDGAAAPTQVFDEFGAELGTFLNPFARAFRAEAILVLGGIAAAFDLFGKALNRTLSIPAVTGTRGAAAALLGAAELFFEEPSHH
jgi:glucokinase